MLTKVRRRPNLHEKRIHSEHPLRATADLSPKHLERERGHLLEHAGEVSSNVLRHLGARADVSHGSEWSPVFTLRTVLLSLRSLLADPQPLDPQDGEVAKVFLSDPVAAQQTAKYWTEVSRSSRVLDIA